MCLDSYSNMCIDRGGREGGREGRREGGRECNVYLSMLWILHIPPLEC